MERQKDIQKKIDQVLNAVPIGTDINVSPFFKDKTMQRLFIEKTEKRSAFWFLFSPQLQLATLACVIVLNVLTLTKLKESAYNENISQFAESYGLSTTTETSLLN